MIVTVDPSCICNYSDTYSNCIVACINFDTFYPPLCNYQGNHSHYMRNILTNNIYLFHILNSNTYSSPNIHRCRWSLHMLHNLNLRAPHRFRSLFIHLHILNKFMLKTYIYIIRLPARCISTYFILVNPSTLFILIFSNYATVIIRNQITFTLNHALFVVPVTLFSVFTRGLG